MTASDGPWFPTIYSDKCDGCAKTGKPRCVEFCPNGVFEFQEGKATVAYPTKCGGNCGTVRCSACAPLCHRRAISFLSRNAYPNYGNTVGMAIGNYVNRVDDFYGVETVIISCSGGISTASIDALRLQV